MLFMHNLSCLFQALMIISHDGNGIPFHKNIASGNHFQSLECGSFLSDQSLSPFDKSFLVSNHATNLDNITNPEITLSS